MTIGLTELAWGLGAALALAAVAAAAPQTGLDAAASAAIASLKGKHPAEAERIERGRGAGARATGAPEDGDAAAFRAFVEAEFLPRGRAARPGVRPPRVRARAARTATSRSLGARPAPRRWTSRSAPCCRSTSAWRAFDARRPPARTTCSQSKLAFVALLNFPLHHAGAAAGRRAAPGRGASGRRRGWPSASPRACRRPSTPRADAGLRRGRAPTSTATTSARTTC